MLLLLLMNRILRRARAIALNADLDRPAGTCGRCGHRTYMVKGSATGSVCIWCGIVALLELLLIPEKEYPKVQKELEKELKLKL